jgi:2-dehydropantoate 2-reductase
VSKKIAVLGAGANGGSIGADLTLAGEDVILIDQWPAHVDAMRQRGLRIEMPSETREAAVRAYHLCDVCTFTEQFDIVLLLMKAYDTRWSCQLIEPYVKPDGLVAAVQNGMTTDIVASVVGAQRTIGCVIEISSMMFDPGVINRDSPPSRSWFAVGSIHPSSAERVPEICSLLKHSGAVQITDDIRASKWMKLVSNATTLVSTALLGLSMHEAVALPGMRELMLRSGQEALDLGVPLGHRIMPIFGLGQNETQASNRLVEMLLDTLLAGFTLPTTKTTVLQDWLKGRRSEAGDLNGLVAAEAMRLGRKAPTNAAIYELARSIEKHSLKPDPTNLALLIDLAERYARGTS